MSTLGDEIRAQQHAASALAAGLHRSVDDLRARMSSTDWVSSAANNCRDVVARFATRIDAHGNDATSLGGDIARHATSVEHHEAVAKALAAAALAAPLVMAATPVHALGHAVESAGSVVGDALHRPDRDGSFDYAYPGDWRG